MTELSQGFFISSVICIVLDYPPEARAPCTSIV